MQLLLDPLHEPCLVRFKADLHCLGLCPGNACVPEHIHNQAVYQGIRAAVGLLHLLKQLQGCTPLASLVVGSDHVGVSRQVGLAPLLAHALQYVCGQLGACTCRVSGRGLTPGLHAALLVHAPQDFCAPAGSAHLH